MSKAFKCDRCKKCFDPIEVEDEQYFATISEIVLQNGEQYSNTEVGVRILPTHLCPDCTETFMKFMKDPELQFGKVRTIIRRLDDKERGKVYDKGFADGVAAYTNVLFGDQSVFRGRKFGPDTDGPDEAAEREECPQKDSKH